MIRTVKCTPVSWSILSGTYSYVEDIHMEQPTHKAMDNIPEGTGTRKDHAYGETYTKSYHTKRLTNEEIYT